jgi:hypothetical protein
VRVSVSAARALESDLVQRRTEEEGEYNLVARRRDLLQEAAGAAWHVGARRSRGLARRGEK